MIFLSLTILEQIVS